MASRTLQRSGSSFTTWGSFYFWEQTCIVYDRVSSMLIAILWGYIIPLAFYPSKGCPSDDQACWDFVTLLFGYIILSTIILPMLAVSIIKHCSLKVYELGLLGATTKKKYYISAQTLLLASVGTIWSVANSQFVYNAIRQVAYTGYHSYHISTVIRSKDMSGNILTETNNTASKWYPISDEFDDSMWMANNSIEFANPTLAINTSVLVRNSTSPRTTMNNLTQSIPENHHANRSNNSEWYNQSFISAGNQSSPADVESVTSYVQSHRRRLGQDSSEQVFVANSPARAEMRWGMLASFCFGVGYTGLACISISGVSTLCQLNAWFISRSTLTNPYGSIIQAYLIELGMLLQDNWYYVCGYSWQIFWSYTWFGSSLVSKSTVGPWTLMFLDVFRAVLFTCGFTSLAIYVVPLLLFTARNKKMKNNLSLKKALDRNNDEHDNDFEGDSESSGDFSDIGDGGGDCSDIGDGNGEKGIEDGHSSLKVQHNLKTLTSSASKQPVLKSRRVLASEIILKHYEHLSVDDLLLRLVILSFKSTAVIVAVSIADLPTSFITSFLADRDVLHLSTKKQLICLTVIGFCGVLLFSVIEAK